MGPLRGRSVIAAGFAVSLTRLAHAGEAPVAPSAAISPPPPPPAAAFAPVVAPPSGPSAPPPASAPTTPPPPPPPPGPPPQITYPAAPPPPPVVQVDNQSAAAAEPPPPVEDLKTHPRFDLNAAAGVAFGGDNLATATFTDGTTEDLPAGRGAIFSIGAMATPLWTGPLGLGVGVDIGVKYTSIAASNGSLSLTRFPLVLSAHALLEVGHYWYLLAGGGLHHELGVRASGDGLLSGVGGDLDSSWGGMGELGAYYAKRHLGASGSIRYTSLRYSVGGQSVDASNIGVFAVIHYNFL